jgi:PPOX class probable F420-dependent enzyme
MQLPPDVIDERLERWPVARLATVADDGRPHQVPIVYARSGGRLWSPIDGKPKRGGQLARVRYLRARPRASILLDEYGPDWNTLWWIRIDATAEIVEGASPVDPEVAGALAALEAKYPQYAEVPVLREDGTLLAFRPERVTSWAAARA